jgi:hypothetical protein
MRHVISTETRSARGLMDEMPDDANRARAAQVVASTLEAMGTSRALRKQISTPIDQ